jgi:hypothetical protein
VKRKLWLLVLFILLIVAVAGCMPSDAKNLGDFYTNNIYPDPSNAYNNGNSSLAWENIYSYHYYVWNPTSGTWVLITGTGSGGGFRGLVTIGGN